MGLLFWLTIISRTGLAREASAAPPDNRLTLAAIPQDARFQAKSMNGQKLSGAIHLSRPDGS